jgi:hypothetical protein
VALESNKIDTDDDDEDALRIIRAWLDKCDKINPLI